MTYPALGEAQQLCVLYHLTHLPTLLSFNGNALLMLFFTSQPQGVPHTAVGMPTEGKSY